MKPGHENCPHDVEEVQAIDPGGCQVVTLRTDIICEHYHTDPVQAIDGTNTGPIIADYCNCCGAMRRREDYR